MVLSGLTVEADALQKALLGLPEKIGPVVAVELLWKKHWPPGISKWSVSVEAGHLPSGNKCRF
jgi:hypothetical protein